MMKVVPYDKKYKNDFIEMNRRWITEMFEIEDEDIAVLYGVDDMVEKGAQVFFAVDDDNAEDVLACCMIAPLGKGEWEIEKFCAKGMYTGKGAGTACLKACIDYAKQQQGEKIIILSNLKCVHALKLYRKFGFHETPVDSYSNAYHRVDIVLEMNL